MERWLLDRRAVVAGLGAVGAGVIAVRSAGGQESYGEASTGAGAAPAKEEGPFSFETVIDRARTLAAEDFVAERLQLVEPFAELSYDAYRAIRFRPERRFWLDEDRGFQLDLLPPGLFYEDRLELSIVRDGRAQPIAFDPGLFHFHPDYFPFADGAAPADVSRDLGYSGFRIRHAINRPDVMDEFLVFQGASYFRAVARNQLYGLSARGLALGTGSPDGEEFPVFRGFWIYEPETAATSLRIQALLDSPSVAGAFEFVVHPGAETVMDIRSVLFPRVDLTAVGIAPLTSMYFFGPKSRAGVDDFRNAVHDSSGLQIVTGAGERLWRPLDNPTVLQFSAFVDRDPQGYALAQRSRAFDHFEDAEARYDRRPSAWVAPSHDWGSGSIVLLEIPTDSEFNDNTVAFWRPAEPLTAAREHRFDYRLHWSDQPPDQVPLARVAATRGGASVNAPERRSIVVDFALAEEQSLDDLEPRVSASAGEITHVSLIQLPDETEARVAIGFDPGDVDLAELRLALVDPKGRTASEVWLARWTRR